VERLKVLDQLEAEQSGCLPALQKMCLVEEKVEGDDIVMRPDARRELEQQVEYVQGRLLSNGVDVVLETKLLPADQNPNYPAFHGAIPSPGLALEIVMLTGHVRSHDTASQISQFPTESSSNTIQSNRYTICHSNKSELFLMCDRKLSTTVVTVI
jgi:hypothetical protein